MNNQPLLLRCIFLLAILFFSLVGRAQWQFLGSPETGRVFHFNKDGNRFYSCTRSGLFYSEDAGILWTEIPLPPTISTANEIYSNNGVLYLFTRKEYLLGNFPFDLFRSKDLGISWDNIFPFSENHFFTFHTPIIKGDTLVLLADDSIAISLNIGESYSMIKNTLGSPEHAILHKNKLIAIENEVMYISDNLGIIWDSLYSSPPHYFGLNVFSIGDTLYKIEHQIINPYEIHHISWSTDNGHTWLPLIDLGYLFILFPTLFGENQDLFLIKPFSYNKLYHSPDRGNTWRILENKVNASMFSFAGDLLFAHNVDHVQISRNQGEAFEIINNGLSAANVSGIAVMGDGIWNNSNSYVYEYMGQQSWEKLDLYENIQSTDDGFLLALSNNILKRSEDGGSSWIEIPPSTLGITDFNSIYDLFSTGNVFFIAGSSIWYSLDKGISWSLFDELNLLDNGLRATGHDHLNYVVCDYSGNILKSADAIVWENITHDLWTSGNGSMKMVHTHNEHFFAFNNRGTFMLSPGSTVWKELISPFSFQNPNSPPGDFSCMVSYGNLLIGGSYGHGVFVSDDSGDTWKEINFGLSDYQVNVLKIFNDNLYLGVDGGVWVRSLDEITNVSEKNEYLLEALYTVSPNPASTMIHINFLDKEVETGTIQIFSIDGILITSKQISITDNSVQIANLNAGLYYALFTNSSVRGIEVFAKL